MKKYLMMLCIAQSIYGAQQTVEWDAHAYAAGNRLQREAALYFITHNNLNLAGKKILDVGCGTGEITGYMAENAQFVHGIDASKNMITYAQEMEQKKHRNISFEQCAIEHYYTEEKFDLATSFSCFHWFADQPTALKQMHSSLDEHGEIFLDVMTSDTPPLTGLPILEQMLAELDPSKNIANSFSHTFITSGELKDIILKAGFEIILCEEQVCEVAFDTPDEVEAFVKPVMMSRPFMKELSPEKQVTFFNEYIKRLLIAMKKTEDGKYIETVSSTIVYARKK